MKTVILAEKPSQALSYAEAMQSSTTKEGYIEVHDSLFSGDCVITYGFGHLVSLKDPKDYREEWDQWELSQLPMYPDSFEYKVTSDKKKQFNIVKKLMKEADEIVIATDIDREGEAIGRYIINLAGCSDKTIKRLWVNSLEKDVVRQGFANLKDANETYNYFVEAQTRGQADWLVGMNLSRLMTLLTRQQLNGYRGTFSIGRVQTPTLYMIYQRIQDIQQFKPEPYQEIEADIQHSEGTFRGKLIPAQKFFDKDQSKLQQLLNDVDQNDPNGYIASVKKEKKETKAPQLFSLSKLQTKANQQFKASANDTLKAVQSLYEKKLLTYPRTDCQYITEEEFDYLSSHVHEYCTWLNVSLEQPQLTPNKRFVNSKKVQEHHAIILTKQTPKGDTWNQLSTLEQNIYRLVAKQTVAMFFPNYEYEETVITTQYQSLQFQTKGKIPLKQGWKILFKGEAEESQNNKDNKEENTTLPPVFQGDHCQVTLDLVQKETQPPQYFTEGSLITAMKTAGKYVEDNEEADILKEVEGIGTEATRAGIIETLKQRQYIKIEKNKVMVTDSGTLLCQIIEPINVLKSPEMTAKWEKVLKTIGEAPNQSTAYAIQTKFINRIKQFIDHELKEAPNYFSSDEVKQSLETQQQAIQKENEKRIIGKCPKCGHSIVDRKTFYSCENYKECDAPTVPKTWSGKKLPKDAVLALFNGKPTEELTFKSKTGKSYKAKLQFNAEGKLQPIFSQKNKK